MEEAADLFGRVPVRPAARPKVAIFGDLYVRDNEVMNQELVRCIEEAGGEVVTTPYSDYIKIVAAAAFRHMARRAVAHPGRPTAPPGGDRPARGRYRPLLGRLAGEPVSWRNPGWSGSWPRSTCACSTPGSPTTTSSRSPRLVKAHPDLALFVQANPAFCCPSLVTEAMSARIERVTGVPVVTLTYDGTGSPRNDRLFPYLHFSR